MYSKKYLIVWLYNMADTTQINFRIPVELKAQAQEKAESYGTNLNFLIKLFLTKFVKWDNVVQISQDVDMEKIFDDWIVDYLSSKEWKTRTRRINRMLTDITDNPEEEKKYLV